MLTSGVNLLQALGICAASSGNVIIEEFVKNVRTSLERGAKLSEPLGEGGLFPDMVVSMVAVGEATGALDEMLAKVSEFYEEEVDLAVQTMLSMIEPIMIVGIGGVVGFIVIAMYLPVFDMAGGTGG
jgi:type IV pilus assembly protein PilC